MLFTVTQSPDVCDGLVERVVFYIIIEVEQHEHITNSCSAVVTTYPLTNRRLLVKTSTFLSDIFGEMSEQLEYVSCESSVPCRCFRISNCFSSRSVHGETTVTNRPRGAAGS